MPEYWAVTVNGMVMFKGMTKPEAEAKAEKWQGQRYKGGLLKHKDYGDHVEIRRDKDTETEWDNRYADLKQGKYQTIVKEDYIQD
jgi:hypothetical protein